MHGPTELGCPAAGARVSAALDRALQSSESLLDRLPVGIYSCDLGGLLVR
jgi:hypothetical protein